MRVNFLFVFFCLISFIARSQNQQSSAIIHANVVNVITGKIDPDQTILIDSGRIVAVGSTKKMMTI